MEQAASYTPTSILTDPRVPETFHVGRHPPGLTPYWAYMIKHEIYVGIQLEFIPFQAYHLNNLNESVELWEWKLELIQREEEPPNIVRRVYSITESNTGNSRLFHHFELEWPDMATPDEASLLSVMKNYASLIHQDESCRNVHVHCWGGYGRSGTLVFARILSFYPDISREEAMGILSRLRRVRSIVETEAQEEFAILFAQKYRVQLQVGEEAVLGSATTETEESKRDA